jgi:hypothetical protein
MFPKVHQPLFGDAPLDCAVDFGIADEKMVITVTCIVLPESNPIEHALSQLKQVQTMTYFVF